LLKSHDLNLYRGLKTLGLFKDSQTHAMMQEFRKAQHGSMHTNMSPKKFIYLDWKIALKGNIGL